MHSQPVPPVEDILAEASGGDLGLEVAVRRRDDPDVDGDRLRPADPLELPILEHAEQLRLRLEGQLADLVEEERAAVGQLEAADAPRVGPREGALLVPEQLALDERRRERGAVALDERAVPPRAP